MTPYIFRDFPYFPYPETDTVPEDRLSLFPSKSYRVQYPLPYIKSFHNFDSVCAEMNKQT